MFSQNIQQHGARKELLWIYTDVNGIKVCPNPESSLNNCIWFGFEEGKSCD